MSKNLLDALVTPGAGPGGGSPHGGTAAIAPQAPSSGNLLDSLGSGANLSALSGGSSLLDSLGGAAGGADQAPSAVANASLQKDLAFIQGSGNQGAINQANQVAAGKTNSKGSFLGNILHDVANPLTKVLSGLDYPRSAVVATAGGIDGMLNGKGFNAKQWEQNISDHATTGHILAELEGPKDAQSSAGKWNNRILGIIGDTALDPLNYLGGLGDITKGLDKGTEALTAARHAETAEKVAADSGLPEDAQAATTARANADKLTGNGAVTAETMTRLNRQGVAGLTDGEKDALGVQSGVGFGLKNSRAQLLPSSITDPASRAIHEVGAKIRDKASTSSFAKMVIPHVAVRQGIVDAVHDGDFEKAHDLSQVLKTSVIPMGSRQAFLNEHGPVLRAALSKFAPEQQDDVRRALEGSATDLNPDHVAAVRGALDNMHASALKSGVDMGALKDYFPHQMTDAMRTAAGKANPRQAMAAELGRTLQPGSKLLGHTLVHGDVDEINGVMKDAGLDDLFKTDTPDVLHSYLHGMASRVGKQDWANELDKLGVTHAGDMAKTPEDWESMASSGAFKDAVAPSYVKDALGKLEDERQRSIDKRPSGFGRSYDKMMNVWRNYELAMPGKAIRHTMAGPAWGHWIGGVTPGKIASGSKVWRDYTKGGLDAIKDPEMKQRVQDFLKTGTAHGHGFEDINHGGKLKANPLSADFAYFRGNREAQARLQDYSRFSMYSDARDKGLSNLSAAAKVRSILGDPHNLTDFERNTMRRLVPFYAFLRTQMPAQLKAVAHTPGKFVDFMNAERNMEEGTTPDGVVPSFYNQTMSFKLPWQTKGGDSTYLSPDLPFTRVNQLLSGGNQVISQLAPEIQIPLEHFMGNTNASTGAPFSTTAEDMPGVMNDLHLGPVLAALGLASKQQQAQTDYGVTTNPGTYRITSNVLQALDSILPPLGQARRVDTSGEPNMQARQGTTIMSDLLGQNFRTDDTYQQASELYRRDEILKQMIVSMQNNGTLAPYLKGFKKP